MNSAQGPGRGQPPSAGLNRNEAAERRANLPPATYKAAGAGAQHLQGAPVTYQYQQAPAGRGGPTTFQYQQAPLAPTSSYAPPPSASHGGEVREVLKKDAKDDPLRAASGSLQGHGLTVVSNPQLTAKPMPQVQYKPAPGSGVDPNRVRKFP